MSSSILSMPMSLDGPVLLGEGRRLFDGLGPEHIELGARARDRRPRRHAPALSRGPAWRRMNAATVAASGDHFV